MTAILQTNVVQNAASSTPNLTLDTVGNAISGGTVIMTSPYTMRNKIVNGAMQIDQRNAGASQTFTAAAALAYSIDRWYGYCTGANVTGQRVAGSLSNTYRYQFTGAASVTAIGFGQRIEAINSAYLAGSTVTLAADISNSVLTSVTWTAYYATTTDSFGTLASPTKTQIATGTFTVTSTVTRYSAQISLPSAAVTGLEIVFSVGAQTSGTWIIGNVQLEAGTVATPFEYRNYQQELAMAQRYYAKTFSQGTAPADNVTTTGALRGTARLINTSSQIEPAANWKFPVTMRTNPTVTLYSSGTGATTGQWNNDGSTSYSANARSQFISDSNVDINNAGVLLTASTPWQIQATAVAEL